MNLSEKTIAKIETRIEKATCPEEMPVKFGNKKIGSDTLVFNMGTAYDCPSAKLGLCKVRHICYALKAEAQHHNVTPAYRQRQYLYWRTHDAEDIFIDMLDKITRRRNKTNFIRFNESGDFQDVEDINKLKKLARLFKNSYYAEDIIIYGYSAREDLKEEILKDMPDNLVINGSGFMLNNRFKPIDKENKELYDNICPGDCRDCDKCKKAIGETIYIIKH